MNELALFAGAGGGLYGGKLLGWRCCCAVEIDAYARHVLIARQNDGTFPVFPIWDDVCTFDGRAWRGIVDVVSGGFPCQDVSVAGQGGGIEHGERSGLWREYARIIAEVRPRYVFAENSPMLVSRGLHIVLRDLARLGYDAAWCVLSARDCGAPHLRKRMWVLATPPSYSQSISYADCNGWEAESAASAAFVDALAGASGEQSCGASGFASGGVVRTGSPWVPQPLICRMADGVAYREHRIRCAGNGQVPIVAARAFRLLRKVLEDG